ncbi:MAG: hypothetical protein AAF721_25365, partial [Myxococcota bacterium]
MLWASLLRRWALTAGPIGLVLVLALVAPLAHGAVTIPTPRGWSPQASDATRQRVDEWAERAGGRTVSVWVTTERDDYPEMLA